MEIIDKTRRKSTGFSGCSAVRLAHLLWEQGVVGSNPATPTTKRQSSKMVAFFVVYKRGHFIFSVNTPVFRYNLISLTIQTLDDLILKYFLVTHFCFCH